MKSQRKPFNVAAGYVCSRRNEINDGWVVVYVAKEQGIDVAPNKYAVVCETHNTILGVPSIAKARPRLKVPDFCERCMA